jgi:hypothetical protein
VVTGLSDLGLTYLIFLAGYELDLQKIRGKPLAAGHRRVGDLPGHRAGRGVRPGVVGAGP